MSAGDDHSDVWPPPPIPSVSVRIGTLTEQHLQAIEAALSIKLPNAYRTAMLSLPSLPEYDCAVDNDSNFIIKDNQSLRENGFFGLPWPNHYFKFGGDGAGNVYYLDLSRNDCATFQADHEDGAFSQMEPDFGVWMKEMSEAYTLFEAEEREAEQNREQEHLTKKWWEWWK